MYNILSVLRLLMLDNQLCVEVNVVTS